jgi:hypothetical protein
MPSRRKVAAISRRFLWMIGLTMCDGLVVVELDDELAEVGLQALDAVIYQERIEVDFLGGHRLRLGEPRDAVAAEDGESFASRRRRWRRSGRYAAGNERLLGLGEIVAEVVERVVLDGCGEFPQRRVRVRAPRSPAVEDLVDERFGSVPD